MLCGVSWFRSCASARATASRKYSRFNAPIFISRMAGGIMDSVNRPRELLISDCGRALVAFVAKIIVRTSPAASSPLLISPFPTIRHPSTFWTYTYTYLPVYLHPHFDSPPWSAWLLQLFPVNHFYFFHSGAETLQESF